MQVALSPACVWHVQTFNYNALETLLLVTSMFVLLAGMTFQSGVTVSGSGAHTALTVLVAAVLVASVAVFLAMLTREVYNSVRFAIMRARSTRRAANAQAVVVPTTTTVTVPTLASGAGPSSTGPSVVTTGSGFSGWTNNPLRAGKHGSIATSGPGRLGFGPINSGSGRGTSANGTGPAHSSMSLRMLTVSTTTDPGVAMGRHSFSVFFPSHIADCLPT